MFDDDDVPGYSLDRFDWGGIMVLVVLIVLFATVVFFAQPAKAAEISFCAPVSKLQTRLLKDFGEVALMEWKEKDGTHRVIFVNPETEAWTFVVLDESGYACTMRSGKGFSILASDRGA